MKKIIVTSTGIFWTFVSAVAICSNGCSLTEGSDQARKESPKSLSLVDVSSHKTIDDCWIVVDDGVYDITDYIKNHPTPPEVITSSCGKDATEAYRTKGGRGRPHSSSADGELKKFHIGNVSK